MKRLIKKILKESFLDDFDMSSDYKYDPLNWEQDAEDVGGVKKLADEIYGGDYNNFLDRIPQLEEEQLKTDTTKVMTVNGKMVERNYRYVMYKDGERDIMAYDHDTNQMYVENSIWTFLRDGFGLNSSEISDIFRDWIKENYRLDVPYIHSQKL
jgi:hypothetical protein